MTRAGQGAAASPARDAYAERTRAFYEGEVRRHGFSYRGLGYNNQDSQLRRFAVLAEVADLDGCRVLDVGAGLGDFLAFLWGRGVVCDYTGLDLCEHLVDRARERFAGRCEGPHRFLAGDILAHEDEPYDYVVSSGIFGLKTRDTVARVEPTLERLYALSRRGVAVNFLSARATVHAARSEYLEPGAVLDAGFRLTPALQLRHDYLPNDFTLYLYREPRWPRIA